jgi:hypothetical protein
MWSKLSEYFGYIAGAAGLIVGSFLISLLVITLLIVMLPPTFFLDSHVRDLWVDHHPVIRWTGRALKNVLGLAVLLFGLFLLVPGVPGQGLLTILIGMILVDVPGKRRVERWLLAQRRVYRMVNAIRARFGRPPMLLEDPPEPQ